MVPRSRYWARELTLIAMVCAPVFLSAQQEVIGDSSADKSTSLDRSLSSIPEPLDTTHSWNSSTRWNVRLKVTSFHSSKTGWATVAAPAAGHRFNNTLSVEATIPIYVYRLANSRLTHPPSDVRLVDQRWEPGDLICSSHARFRSEHSHYQLTGSISVPAGDKLYSLSSGRVAFDLTSHIQRTFGRFTPTLTAGAGDSTLLANRLVTKTSSSLGPLGHFRAGLTVRLAQRFSFAAEATEQMPIGDQKTYATEIEAFKTSTVVTGRTVAERNGLEAVFDAILDRRTVFTSYYTHSMRPGGDTVSVALTYSLRSSLPGKDLARDDLFR